MMGPEFALTSVHIALVRKQCVDWDASEFGAPTIDPKRPYGNGDAIGDIVSIIEEVIGRSARHLTRGAIIDLHESTEEVLQIVLATGEFKVGVYRRVRAYDSRSWEWVRELSAAMGETKWEPVRS